MRRGGWRQSTPLPGAALIAVVGTAACASLWPTSHAVVPAPPSDVLACAASQAKALGYRVLPDTTHGTLTAEKTLPQRDLSADVTEYSRKNVLQVSFAKQGADATLLDVQSQTISIQESRRGMTDVPVSALADVRADADTLLARCRQAAPSSSLP